MAGSSRPSPVRGLTLHILSLGKLGVRLGIFDTRFGTGGPSFCRLGLHSCQDCKMQGEIKAVCTDGRTNRLKSNSPVCFAMASDFYTTGASPTDLQPLSAGPMV